MKIVSKYALPERPELMLITPEMASDWLQSRLWDGNRRISPSSVERWVKVIRDGRWKATHQGLAFDAFGRIQDGQNRLKAISMADTSVWVWVFPDMPVDNFEAIDGGVGRTASQFIHSGAPSVVAGALRYISAAIDPDHSGVYRKRMDLHESLEMWRAWPEVENWCKQTNVVRCNTRIPSPILTAVLAMGERGGASKEVITEFMDGLKTGGNLETRDPRLQLRNRWLRGADQLKGPHRRTHAYALIVKTYNLYARGERVGKLIYTDGDHIPLPHGVTWGGVRLNTEEALLP